MSDAHKRNFYGETDTPTVQEIFERLCVLTGSGDCANELIESADYVEWVCGPEPMLMAMPECIQ